MIQLISNLNFRYVFSSIFFFHFALFSMSLIQGWVIFDLTNSPNKLGFILGSISVFSLSLILLGGVLSDVYEKKKVIMDLFLKMLRKIQFIQLVKM